MNNCLCYSRHVSHVDIAHEMNAATLQCQRFSKNARMVLRRLPDGIRDPVQRKLSLALGATTSNGQGFKNACGGGFFTAYVQSGNRLRKASVFFHSCSSGVDG